MSLDDQTIRVGVCDRRNSDTRSYKVLMNVAGDSAAFAIEPENLRSAGKAIASMLTANEANADYVIGFAPGGIAIAIAVAAELNKPTIVAYKTRLDLDDELTWIEPHCFTNTFYLYGVTAGMSLLLVDDEVDSGNTLVNAARALTGAGATVTGVASAVEVTHRGQSLGREGLRAMDLELRALRCVDVDAPQS